MPYIPLQAPLSPANLDSLLAIGWYRMQQHVFTTNVLYLDNDIVAPVFWARLRLENFSPNHRHRKLAKLNRRFQLSRHDAIIDAEIEDVYAAYRDGIDFDASPTATSCLLDVSGVNHFPARMWQMRDAGRLIAAGYFDEGETSIAGILNFFHPDYRKYSPGLWMYLEGVRYAAETGKAFYYPGYIALEYTKFDYKLLAGSDRMELWDVIHQQWIPYADSVHAAAMG